MGQKNLNYNVLLKVQIERQCKKVINSDWSWKIKSFVKLLIFPIKCKHSEKMAWTQFSLRILFDPVDLILLQAHCFFIVFLILLLGANYHSRKALHHIEAKFDIMSILRIAEIFPILIYEWYKDCPFISKYQSLWLRY